ncbi:MAG: type I restriction enzyme HsdR N-terminal domain-containing protein [Heliobacteriaceae bacterium]|nr:type I restriction enzyme HsdR N-terminal domain-containing protein [Heliobacteriaceae bacterium]
MSGVVKPFLTEILGYDEFEDLTDEFAVRGTYCDICIKANGKPYIMIEAKAANVTLKDMHAKQAKDYGIAEFNGLLLLVTYFLRMKI